MPIHRRAVGKAQICVSLSDEEVIKLEAYSIRYKTSPGALVRAYVRALPNPTPSETALALAKLHFRRQRQASAQTTRATHRVEGTLELGRAFEAKLAEVGQALAETMIEVDTDVPVDTERCEDCGLTPRQKLKSATLRIGDQQPTTRRLCEACVAAYRDIGYGIEEKGGEIDG